MYPPISFNPKIFIDAANTLLCCDETKRALDLLDNLPAYYRQPGKEPKEITDLRNEIMKWIATPSFYATHAGVELTAGEHCTKMIGTLRGMLLVQDVKACNEKGLKPVFIDLGPGEFWAPRLLESQGLDFYYKPIYVNQPSYQHYLKYFEKYLFEGEKEGPKIFLAGEILEHLWQPMDIRFEMQKIGTCDVTHITTPNCTFNPNVTDWKTITWLGHLHAFTFEEFRQISSKIFKEYVGAFYDSHVFHGRFILPSSKYDFLKTHYDIK